MLNGLYVLTDSRVYPQAQWPSRVEAVIQGGTKVIQLRDKSLSDDELMPYACELLEVCQSHNIPLIINDRVELAKKVGAEGVHIGKDDQSLHAVREYLGNDFYIGISCYRNIDAALKAQQLGADYVAFGSLFPSMTKRNALRCPLPILQQASRQLTIPVCGIGGITANNITKVAHAGALLIAVSDAVFNADDPKAASKIMSGIIPEH